MNFNLPIYIYRYSPMFSVRNPIYFLFVQGKCKNETDHMICVGWLVGCFGFNGPLRQYFSLYRVVSQREGERGERIDESKNVQTTPTRTYCKRNRPCPTVIKIVGRPGTGSLPSTIAPPDHLHLPERGRKKRE